MCCWRHLVPFMIALTEMIATVIESNPCMLLIGVMGGVMSIVYNIVVLVAAVGIYMENKEQLKAAGDQGVYGSAFILTLIVAWGSMVCSNFCHVCYCSVFGRWYHR